MLFFKSQLDGKDIAFLKKLSATQEETVTLFVPTRLKNRKRKLYGGKKKHLNSRFVDVKPTFQMSGQNQKIES